MISKRLEKYLKKGGWRVEKLRDHAVVYIPVTSGISSFCEVEYELIAVVVLKDKDCVRCNFIMEVKDTAVCVFNERKLSVVPDEDYDKLFLDIQIIGRTYAKYLYYLHQKLVALGYKSNWEKFKSYDKLLAEVRKYRKQVRGVK